MAKNDRGAGKDGSQHAIRLQCSSRTATGDGKPGNILSAAYSPSFDITI